MASVFVTLATAAALAPAGKPTVASLVARAVRFATRGAPLLALLHSTAPRRRGGNRRGWANWLIRGGVLGRILMPAGSRWPKGSRGRAAPGCCALCWRDSVHVPAGRGAPQDYAPSGLRQRQGLRTSCAPDGPSPLCATSPVLTSSPRCAQAPNLALTLTAHTPSPTSPVAPHSPKEPPSRRLRISTAQSSTSTPKSRGTLLALLDGMLAHYEAGGQAVYVHCWGGGRWPQGLRACSRVAARARRGGCATERAGSLRHAGWCERHARRAQGSSQTDARQYAKSFVDSVRAAR